MDINVFVDNVAPLESSKESANRAHITTLLEEIACEWLRTEEVSVSSTKLLTFGSSILGVVTNESDLDTVLLIPTTISRDRFFSGFMKVLTSQEKGLVITSIMAVPDAHVPVLKMVVNGLPVDILPCRIPAKQLKAFLESGSPSGQFNFKLISSKDLCTPSLLALNGVRVGRTLIDSITAGRVIGDDEQVTTGTPEGASRVAKFQVCLRFIKQWAKSRGIYSNILGYFGGVSWAILLVKVCLLSTDTGLVIDTLSEREIVAKFFKFCFEWRWGAPHPITLKPLPNGLAQFLTTLRSATSTPSMSALPSPDAELDDIAAASEDKSPSPHTMVTMWDPLTSDVDRKSLMPVLTPIAPYMNSTFNAVVSTQRILTDEFRRAFELTNGAIAGSVGFDPAKVCSPAFDELRTHFGLLLPLRLSVSPSVTDPAERKRLLFVWKSLIESKLRVLVFHIERMPGAVCRPFPAAVPVNPSSEANGEALEFLVAISFVPSEDATNTVDLNYAVAQFHGALSATLESRNDRDELRKFCMLQISLDSRR